MKRATRDPLILHQYSTPNLSQNTQHAAKWGRTQIHNEHGLLGRKGLRHLDGLSALILKLAREQQEFRCDGLVGILQRERVMKLC